ncbi:MAG TPA: M13 family metallopeptidase [Candidatus Saccharimonadales bacterium]|nr:M13 family metallopeptidase [Candidatus Saccharimonadales bacterium]
MRLQLRAALPVVAVLALLACAPAPAAAAPNHGLDLANMDTTVSPCVDFNRYANGAWLERTQMPPSYGRYGGFEELADRNQEDVHRLLEEIRADVSAAPGTNRWKLAAFYGACMDSQLADSLGIEPLRPVLARIDQLQDVSGLARLVGELHADAVNALFRFGAGADRMNSSMTIAQAGQGGLGLPDRDSYLKADTASERLRADYQAHVARTFQLLGDPEAQAAAQKVVALETALATVSMPRVAMRDPRATYHMMALTELQGMTPSFRWADYLAQIGQGSLQKLNVATPDFFKGAGRLLDSVPVADWKSYLRWHATEEAAPLLSRPFVEENFRFSQRLSGAQEMQPRWKRCLGLTEMALGEAVGQEYVARHFSPEAKARALAMVKNLEAALESRIRTLGWMTDSTRAQALVKLHAFTEKIGYPDKWRDYSALQLEKRQALLNLMRAQQFERNRRLARIGKPVDRGEWNMIPPTVNAYYNPSNNEIVFPAGILRPPFFDPNADDALNYGGIGAVIGHEMTHGFDDSGRKFDAQGNLRDWWTAQDAEKYEERAQKIVNQFNGYVAVGEVHLNGKLTLGENIADLGGLTVAYEALQRSMKGKPRPAPIDGFTPEQRFFLGWAQVWRELMRPEMRRTRAMTDSHSPGMWRINGPLSNMTEFHQAFGCKPGDPMYRPDSLRARIW